MEWQICILLDKSYAVVAQMVEHFIGSEEVPRSIRGNSTSWRDGTILTLLRRVTPTIKTTKIHTFGLM